MNGANAWDTGSRRRTQQVQSVFEVLLVYVNDVWRQGLPLARDAAGGGIVEARRERTPVPVISIQIFIPND
jgi:hypothetical protein